MKKSLLFGLGLLLAPVLAGWGQTPTLLKDIIPGSASCYPSNFTPVVGGLLFTGVDPAGTSTDGVLWKTDGTAAGTAILRNIPVVSSRQADDMFVRMGAFLYFLSNNATTGTELWKTDGTAAGTTLVKDIWPGLRGSFPTCLTVMNNKLYFQAEDNVAGRELWVTDGTTAGTQLVKDILPGSFGTFDNASGQQMAAANGSLFFRAWEAGTGNELWKSDGTAAGTVMVKDLVPGVTGCYPEWLTSFNGKAYFTADDRTTGIELYVSDGTANGTHIVRDINTTPNRGSIPTEMREMGTNLYFFAITPATGRELWKTDGTSNGTVLVKDILPGAAAGVPGLANYNQTLTPFRGYLYFQAADGTGFEVLYRTDGTAAGTLPFGPPVRLTEPIGLTVTNNTLFFRAYDWSRVPAIGVEPWKSDGTVAGTVSLGDLNPGSDDSGANGFTFYNGAVIFSANDNVHGQELWHLTAAALATRPAALPEALVWPNPAHDRATVQLPAGLGSTPATLTLTDALGRVVLTRTLALPASSDHTELDLQGLAPGLYAVRLSTAKAVFSQPLVVE